MKKIIFDTNDFDDREVFISNDNKAYFDKVFEILENYFGRNAQILPESGFSASDINDALSGKTALERIFDYRL